MPIVFALEPGEPGRTLQAQAHQHCAGPLLLSAWAVPNGRHDGMPEIPAGVRTRASNCSLMSGSYRSYGPNGHDSRPCVNVFFEASLGRCSGPRDRVRSVCYCPSA